MFFQIRACTPSAAQCPQSRQIGGGEIEPRMRRQGWRGGSVGLGVARLDRHGSPERASDMRKDRQTVATNPAAASPSGRDPFDVIVALSLDRRVGLLPIVDCRSQTRWQRAARRPRLIYLRSRQRLGLKRSDYLRCSRQRIRGSHAMRRVAAAIVRRAGGMCRGLVRGRRRSLAPRAMRPTKRRGT